VTRSRRGFGNEVRLEEAAVAETESMGFYCLKCINIETFIASKIVVYIYLRILWP